MGRNNSTASPRQIPIACGRTVWNADGERRPPDLDAFRALGYGLGEPTPQERELVDSYMAEIKAKPTVPSIKVVQGKDGVTQLDLDHPDKFVASCLLSEAVGSKDHEFLNGILGQLANLGSKGQKIDEAGLNFMVSMVKGVAPRDQVEAMLAVQMAAVSPSTSTRKRNASLKRTTTPK